MTMAEPIAEPILVQDVMAPITELHSDTTVGDALRTMEQRQAAFGVVSGAEGELLALVTAEQLRDANARLPVQLLVAGAPRPIIVEPRMRLATIAQTLAEDLELNPDCMGIIVQEQGNLHGVLPRRLVVAYAAQMSADRSTQRLEGDPLNPIPRYECPLDHEKKYVLHYDPQNPPKCSKGHLMKRVK